MSCAISSADACPSLKIRLRVRYMRPHDATPTVTATLTAMSQIFVRMVKGFSPHFSLLRERERRPALLDCARGTGVRERQRAGPRQTNHTKKTPGRPRGQPGAFRWQE